MTTTCRKCKEPKTKGDFYKSNGFTCIECMKAYATARRIKYPEASIMANRKHYQKNRTELLQKRKTRAVMAGINDRLRGNV